MMANTFYRRLSETVDTLGGLVRRHMRREDYATDLGLAFARQSMQPGALERYVPSMACWQSVSQRSLSNPITFLSDLLSLHWGEPLAGPVFSLLAQLLTGPGGAITPPAGQDTLRFNDANAGARAQLRDRVLIGMRAKVTVMVEFEDLPLAIVGTHQNSGDLAETIENFIRDYVEIGIFNTADASVINGVIVLADDDDHKAGDPWLGFTPLRYFDRPPGDFLPVPPLLWAGRDLNCQIAVRDGQFGHVGNKQYNDKAVPMVASGNTTGIAATVDQNVTIQLGILVESIFVPNPRACSGSWPGELCPTHKIGNHPDYNSTLPVFIVHDDGQAYAVTCTDCGSERQTPTPPDVKISILDPRHNLREGCKQMLLLEDHLFHADKWCPDCVHKHCLFLEALGEEGRTLGKGEDSFREWSAEMGELGRAAWARLEAGEDRAVVGADVRTFRKKTTKMLR